MQSTLRAHQKHACNPYFNPSFQYLVYISIQYGHFIFSTPLYSQI